MTETTPEIVVHLPETDESHAYTATVSGETITVKLRGGQEVPFLIAADHLAEVIDIVRIIHSAHTVGPEPVLSGGCWVYGEAPKGGE